jgi:hypothetical protein
VSDYPTWRPRNETPEDLRHETETAEILLAKYGITAQKLSETQYCFDWTLSKDDQVIALAEFKQRKTKYDTLLLSAAKYEAGMRYSKTFKKPFVLFVRWPDGLFSYKFTDDFVPEVKMGGNSRGQNGDIEPCVFIPVDLFIRIAD